MSLSQQDGCHAGNDTMYLIRRHDNYEKNSHVKGERRNSTNNKCQSKWRVSMQKNNTIRAIHGPKINENKQQQ